MVGPEWSAWTNCFSTAPAREGSAFQGAFSFALRRLATATRPTPRPMPFFAFFSSTTKSTFGTTVAPWKKISAYGDRASLGGSVASVTVASSRSRCSDACAQRMFGAGSLPRHATTDVGSAEGALTVRVPNRTHAGTGKNGGLTAWRSHAGA